TQYCRAFGHSHDQSRLAFAGLERESLARYINGTLRWRRAGHADRSQVPLILWQIGPQSVAPRLYPAGREFALRIGSLLRGFRPGRAFAVKDKRNIRHRAALLDLTLGRIGCEDETPRERTERDEPQLDAVYVRSFDCHAMRRRCGAVILVRGRASSDQFVFAIRETFKFELERFPFDSRITRSDLGAW